MIPNSTNCFQKWKRDYENATTAKMAHWSLLITLNFHFVKPFEIQPVSELLMTKYPDVRGLHYFTDGPTTQYRNKTNFLLMCEICTNTNFDLCTWNFWEAGHGKGAPDGIGGLVKRNCDRAVAMGKDVTDVEVFLNTINHQNINSFLIDGSKIDDKVKKVQHIQKDNTILPVPGTMKLKCLTWNRKQSKYFLSLKRLAAINAKLKIHVPTTCSNQ